MVEVFHDGSSHTAQLKDPDRAQRCPLIDVRNAVTIEAWETAGSRGRRPETIVHMHPHMARHTYGSHLISAGVPIAHVAELLGDTVAVIESTYSHIMRPKHEVASVAAKIFG